MEDVEKSLSSARESKNGDVKSREELNGDVRGTQNDRSHESDYSTGMAMNVNREEVTNGGARKIQNCLNQSSQEPKLASMCSHSDGVAHDVSEIQSQSNSEFDKPTEVLSFILSEGAVNGPVSKTQNCMIHKSGESVEVPTCIENELAVNSDASKIVNGLNYETEVPKDVLTCNKDEGATKGVVRIREDYTEDSSGEILRTYKRRRLSKMHSERKVVEKGRASTEAANKIGDKITEEQLTTDSKDHPCGQAGFCNINASHDCSSAHWRTLILESIYKSLRKSEGGIRVCIHDALEYLKKNDDTSTDKRNNKEVAQCHSQRSLIAHGAHVGADEYRGASLSESRELDNQNATEMFQHSFFNILVSEKFAALCKLLSESFQGVKIDSFFDYNLIDRRMKEGAYERSPGLFTSDILQILGKMQRIGSELVALARGLSNMATDSNCEQFTPCGLDYHSKLELPETQAIDEICSCVHCGEKADGRDCLVCDYCEELYHVSCIEPAVKSIPKRWCCAKCFSSGIDFPHEHCVVCEKLNATGTIPDTDPNATSTNEGETFAELEESSNCITGDGFDTVEESRHTRCCKICSVQIENHETYRTCGHPFCPSKYYHSKCLTKKQLKSHASCWYCPSCLCRVCLKNRDDEKIVLCDACDHGYHIYCMKPPRDMVPRGKWFCRSCKSKIQQIRKAKRAYGILGQKLSKEKEEVDGPYANSERNLLKKCQGQDKSEGVDMLLTAASTLNSEEKLVARQSHLD